MQNVQEELDCAKGIRRVKEAIAEGKRALASRQKSILQVDLPDLGWAYVAKKYEDDEQAKDSEDEKKIKRAEKEAQQEAEQRSASQRKDPRGKHHTVGLCHVGGTEVAGNCVQLAQQG